MPQPPKFVHHRDAYGRPAQVPTEGITSEGALATEFVGRWGMVAATLDGEDSAGRAKLRLLTPEELVERALATSTLLYAELRIRGYLVPIPDFVAELPPTPKE